MAATAGFRALLEAKGVGEGSRWSKMKEELAEEGAFVNVPKSQREVLFRAYVAEQAAAGAAKEGDRSKEEELRKQREREVRGRAPGPPAAARTTDSLTH
eukprot:1890780-Pyramimonas_sp.AAC.1